MIQNNPTIFEGTCALRTKHQLSFAERLLIERYVYAFLAEDNYRKDPLRTIERNRRIARKPELNSVLLSFDIASLCLSIQKSQVVAQ